MIKIIATRFRRAVDRVAASAGRAHGRVKAWWTTPRRAVLYRVLGVIGTSATAYGEIAGERAASIAGVVSLLCSTIVAILNTSTSDSVPAVSVADPVPVSEFDEPHKI